MITNVGLSELITMLVSAANGNGFVYIACGSGSGAEDPYSTALDAENSASGAQRKLATVSVSGNTATITTTFFFTGDVTVCEYGLFDSGTPTGSKMFLRKKLASPRNYIDGNSLQIIITLTINRGE